MMNYLQYSLLQLKKYKTNKQTKQFNNMETYTLITKLLEQLSYDESTAKNPNENYLKAIANAANSLIELKKFY